MGGFKDLFLSERGIVTVLLLVAVTVFVCIGAITFEQWQTYTTVVSSVYLGSKTITGVAAIIKGPAATDDPPSKSDVKTEADIIRASNTGSI